MKGTTCIPSGAAAACGIRRFATPRSAGRFQHHEQSSPRGPKPAALRRQKCHLLLPPSASPIYSEYKCTSLSMEIVGGVMKW